MPIEELNILKITSGVVKEQLVYPGIVSFVEALVQTQVGFPIFQTLPLDPEDTSLQFEKNPIIGYCGKDTLPLIGNPDSDTDVLAISFEQRMLVYNSNGTPPHKMRDSFRWRLPPYHYYMSLGYQEVVREFESTGFSIFESLNSFKFGRAVFYQENFSLGPQTNADRILAS